MPNKKEKGMQQVMVLGVNEEALSEWIEYRREKKKPLSNLALKKTQNLMAKFEYEHQQLMVDAAIMNDWQGLHPIEKPKEHTTRNTSLHQDLTDKSWAH